MKKCVILLIIISLFYISISSFFSKKLAVPSDALRIRIIPNSNSNYDQLVKGKVKDKLEVTLYDLLRNASSSAEARKIIINNLDLVDKDVSKILSGENYGYKIKYGYNYFPMKRYKGIKYEEGYYESLLVTLGKGEGDNWWCVLFPPLCLIEAEENTEIEYKSMVKELLEKYLS
ncbi:MAG: stage II sporulation protein R [Bacilli bacterium]|nr:stage II sporulation protein R [Bacilli bacterium]